MINLHLLVSIVTYKSDINVLNNVIKKLKEGNSFLNFKIRIFDNSGDERISKFCLDNKIDFELSRTNFGFGKAHNINIEALSLVYDYKYVLILNPDLFITQKNLRRLIEYLEHSPDCACVSPLLKNEKSIPQNAIRLLPNPIDYLLRFLNLTPNYSLFINKPTNVPFVHGACLLMRVQDYLQLGGFDERYFLYCEDMDLCRNIISHDRSITVHSNSEAVHIWSALSHKSIKVFLIHLISIAKYYLKWGIISDKTMKNANSQFIKLLK